MESLLKWRLPLGVALALGATLLGYGINAEHQRGNQAELEQQAKALIERADRHFHTSILSITHLGYRIAEADGLSESLRQTLLSKDASHQLETQPGLQEIAVLDQATELVLRQPVGIAPPRLDEQDLRTLLDRTAERGEVTVGVVRRRDGAEPNLLTVLPFRFADGTLGYTVARFGVTEMLELEGGPWSLRLSTPSVTLIGEASPSSVPVTQTSLSLPGLTLLAEARLSPRAVPSPISVQAILVILVGWSLLALVVFYEREEKRRVVDLRRQEELQHALDRAEAATRAKSDFLATMSHEIRTPMHGIMGMASLMTATSLDSEQSDYLQLITQSAEALLTIIDDVLDFSKLESGRFELEPLPIDLVAVFEDALGLVRGQASRKGLELSLRWVPGTPCVVMGDAGRIRQIVLNLVSNAIKFTERGHIAVQVGLNSAREFEVQVEDTGIGIPTDTVDGLFQKFVQADVSTTRKYGGTGLGLAISRALSEAMGGTIGVDSVVGQGSRFWFTMKLPADPEAPPAPSFPQAVVLLADPLKRRREIVAETLVSFGAEVVAVSSRAEVEAALDRLPMVTTALVDQNLWPERSAGAASPLWVRLETPNTPRSVDAAGPTPNLVLPNPLRRSQLVSLLSTGVEAKPARTQRRTLPAALQGRKILLAEDNPVNQLVARRMLEHLGCGVEVAVNGKEAVVMVRTGSYDLVLMDCHMPEMDGYTACRLLRETHAALPIIAFTASATADDHERCRESGMNAVLAKPARPAELTKLLERYLIASPAQGGATGTFG